MPYKDKEDYKKYQKKYHKDWYDMNKENRRKHIKERKFKIYEEVANFKSINKCKICKESNPVALDFHHLSDKKFEISKVSSSRCSFKHIMNEISKCILLCANCHRKEHYREKSESSHS